MSEFKRFEHGGFERWERRRRLSRGRTITIYSTGTIRLSRELLAEIGDPTHFAFLHDAAGKRIAFEPTDDTDPSAYPLRFYKGGVSPMVSARAFLASINQPFTGTYPATVENGRIVAYLAAPGERP